MPPNLSTEEAREKKQKYSAAWYVETGQREKRKTKREEERAKQEKEERQREEKRQQEEEEKAAMKREKDRLRKAAARAKAKAVQTATAQTATGQTATTDDSSATTQAADASTMVKPADSVLASQSPTMQVPMQARMQFQAPRELLVMKMMRNPVASRQAMAAMLTQGLVTGSIDASMAQRLMAFATAPPTASSRQHSTTIPTRTGANNNDVNAGDDGVDASFSVVPIKTTPAVTFKTPAPFKTAPARSLVPSVAMSALSKPRRQELRTALKQARAEKKQRALQAYKEKQQRHAKQQQQMGIMQQQMGEQQRLMAAQQQQMGEQQRPALQAHKDKQ